MSHPQQADTGDLQPGVVIAGKYQLESILGVGGMGAVWRATHLGLGQPVAVKAISEMFARAADARARFDREAKSAAKLKSRHVVQIFDNGELPNGTPYIVMELLEGEALNDWLSRGPLSVSDAATILTQVGRALDRAHALQIVHRDIKPENVFIARSHDDEAGTVVKVLDFGIAKVTQNEPGGFSTTRTGSILGTPMFMSPEQARGLKSVDHRTDLYSLGLLAYTMLTGQFAFGGESLADFLVCICTNPLPSLRASAAWLPPALDAWLQRACHRDPAFRFNTAREQCEAFCVAAGISQGAVLAQSGGAPAYGRPSFPDASGMMGALSPSQGMPAMGVPSPAHAMPVSMPAAMSVPTPNPAFMGAPGMPHSPSSPGGVPVQPTSAASAMPFTQSSSSIGGSWNTSPPVQVPKKSAGPIIAGIVAAVALLGGGAAAAVYFVNRPPQPAESTSAGGGATATTTEVEHSTHAEPSPAKDKVILTLDPEPTETATQLSPSPPAAPISTSPPVAKTPPAPLPPQLPHVVIPTHVPTIPAVVTTPSPPPPPPCAPRKYMDAQGIWHWTKCP